LTDDAIRAYGVHVTNLERGQRDILASGLIGIGFLLNVENAAGLLSRAVPRDIAVQATVVILFLYWGLWLAAAVKLLVRGSESDR
jgi:hypothetical protein